MRYGFLRMLTTHDFIQSTAAYLFPSLLLLIAWYSTAASVRAITEFLYRLRQKRKVGKSIRALSKPLQQKDGDTVSSTMHHYLGGLQSVLEESLLNSKNATGAHVAFTFLEGLLFATLACASFYLAGPIVFRTLDVWWVHLIAPFFFLCLILRARRLLLLIPLTFIALLSWEAVSFVAGFEKTLQSTTLMATVHVRKRIKNPVQQKELNKKGPTSTTSLVHDQPDRVTLDIRYRTGENHTLTLPADKKIFIEGRVFRVSSEVLLFGGRNLGTVERIFSDEMKPKDAFVLFRKETTPPLYRWKNEMKSYLLPQRKLFRWLWREFFILRKKQYVGNKNPIQVKFLEAAICPPPLTPGRIFEIRLRNVGGLECHIYRKKKNVKQKVKRVNGL